MMDKEIIRSRRDQVARIIMRFSVESSNDKNAKGKNSVNKI